MIRSGYRLRRLAAGLVLPLLAAPGAQAASLTVTIAGLRNDHGHVRIGVCTRPEFLGERCSYHAIIPAQAGAVTATIPGIQPGTYAVAAYQDETDAGHLRRGLFGIPAEGIGFSRNPKLGISLPGFDRCALHVGPQDGAVSIELRFF